MTTDLQTMTQQKWQAMTPAEQDAARSLGGLSPQLIGLEGWRVEAVTTYGETRRFIVGRSSGWIPCHIEIARRNAIGGPSASSTYKSVRALYRVR